MHRELAQAQAMLREALADWQANRIMYASEALDVDPQELLDDLRRHGWLVGAVLLDWPAGLAPDDKPQIGDFFPGRRFGPHWRQQRSTSEVTP